MISDWTMLVWPGANANSCIQVKVWIQQPKNWTVGRCVNLNDFEDSLDICGHFLSKVFLPSFLPSPPNSELQISAGTSGPQSRAPDRMSERMPDRVPAIPCFIPPGLPYHKYSAATKWCRLVIRWFLKRVYMIYHNPWLIYIYIYINQLSYHKLWCKKWQQSRNSQMPGT